MSPFLVVLSTALLSALLTAALFGALVRWWLLPRLRAQVDDEVERATARMRAELDEATVRLGDEVEKRVRQGIVDGVAAIPSSEVVQGATRTVARTGAEILGAGLDTIFGRGRGRE